MFSVSLSPWCAVILSGDMELPVTLMSTVTAFRPAPLLRPKIRYPPTARNATTTTAMMTMGTGLIGDPPRTGTARRRRPAVSTGRWFEELGWSAPGTGAARRAQGPGQGDGGVAGRRGRPLPGLEVAGGQVQLADGRVQADGEPAQHGGRQPPHRG